MRCDSCRAHAAVLEAFGHQAQWTERQLRSAIPGSSLKGAAERSATSGVGRAEAPAWPHAWARSRRTLASVGPCTLMVCASAVQVRFLGAAGGVTELRGTHCLETASKRCTSQEKKQGNAEGQKFDRIDAKHTGGDARGGVVDTLGRGHHRGKRWLSTAATATAIRFGGGARTTRRDV